MKVVFYVAPGKFREEGLLQAVQRGVEAAGDGFEVHPNNISVPVAGDVACMIGMKSTDLRLRCLAAGQRVLTFDKGYDRKDDWWRVSVDRHQPTDYLLDITRPGDRMTAAGWQMLPWRKSGQFVLIAGGGAKYHSVWGMEGPADWASRITREIREAGWKGEIQYRPKPSQPDKTVPKGAVLSSPKYMTQALEDCWAMVTFGSNACFEAMCMGVPSIVLGDAVMRDVSSRSIEAVCKPFMAPDAVRRTILSNLAYCQFRQIEWSGGIAWPEVKRQMHEVPPLAREGVEC